MPKFYLLYALTLVFGILFSCQSPKKQPVENPSSYLPTAHKTTDSFELYLPSGHQAATLILFPGLPETPERVKTEFKIISPALQKGIAVVIMKFNRRLWLDDKEKFYLTKTINQLFEEHPINNEQLFIGGFSSGGNISLLLANHLKKAQNIIQPKGVFIIDSPVDLLALYEISQRNIERNFSKGSVQESKGTISRFDTSLGKPANGIERYEKYAPYTHKTKSINNLSKLENVKIRLYTEPDIEWWTTNRQNEYEDMNAYFIKQLADELTQKYGNLVEYMPTENRGYRANGQRHPHAWAIVEINDLLKWILE